MVSTRGPVSSLKGTIAIGTDHRAKAMCSLPGDVAYHKRLSVHLTVPAVARLVTGFSTLRMRVFADPHQPLRTNVS
jgi:hypothetical protein